MSVYVCTYVCMLLILAVNSAGRKEMGLRPCQGSSPRLFICKVYVSSPESHWFDFCFEATVGGTQGLLLGLSSRTLLVEFWKPFGIPETELRLVCARQMATICTISPALSSSALIQCLNSSDSLFLHNPHELYANGWMTISLHLNPAVTVSFADCVTACHFPAPYALQWLCSWLPSK